MLDKVIFLVTYREMRFNVGIRSLTRIGIGSMRIQMSVKMLMPAWL